MNPIHPATITQGKLRFENPNRWVVALAKLEGRAVEVVVRKRRSQRPGGEVAESGGDGEIVHGYRGGDIGAGEYGISGGDRGGAQVEE